MMKRNRRWTATLLAVLMLLALCACGIQEQEFSEKTESAEGEPPTQDTVRIGIVQESDDELWSAVTNSIQRELYVKGNKAGIRVDYKKYTEIGDGQTATLDRIGQDYIDAEVDGIIAVGPMAAKRMKVCTRGTDIPVIFAIITDPVEEGLLKDPEHPDGNVTGAADIIKIRTILQMMIEADSDIEQVGILYSEEQEGIRTSVAEAKRFLNSKGIDYVEQTGSNNDEIFRAAYTLAEEGVDAVLSPADLTVQECEESIYQLFIDAGIPHYGGTEGIASQGAFLGYGASGKELGTAAADMAAEILLEGSEAAETPVRVLDLGVATINTETAEAIGVNVDSIRKVFRAICGEVANTKTVFAASMPEEDERGSE